MVNIPTLLDALLAELCLLVGLGKHLARLLDPLSDLVSGAAPLPREVPGAPMVIHALRDDLISLRRGQILGVGGIGRAPSVGDPILQG